MNRIHSLSPVRKLSVSVLAMVAGLCLLLTMTTSALASTVNISDQAGVLNQSQVQSAASSLRYPISIYTTNNFQGTSSDFDQRTRSHLTGTNLIVIAIDTVHKHLAIVGGSNVPLSSSQYNDAVQAFKNSFNGGDYTGATVAAIRSLQNSLNSAPVGPGNNPGSGNTRAPGGGLFGGLGTSTLCCIGLLVLAALALFAFFRRRRSGGLFGRNPTMAPPPPYNPYNQPYPPNYGPGYGPYNQGGGIGPLGAGGLGAAAGGFLGYELGKEAGEREAREQGGYQGDNSGGGNFGGGDFGGGASGDFGGGGGDFGGGGGGDFGGGGGGSSGNF